MDQATDCLPSIIIIHDNICVFHHTPEEHDVHLLHLMETAKNQGVIFNNTKCHTRQPQIALYAIIFTAQGMQLDPAKIQALQDLPTLTHRQSLSSF